MIDPDMGPWSYGYDILGNLTTQMDARSCLTTLSYDPLNRPPDKSRNGTCSGIPVHYTYDSGGGYGIGKRTGMTDATGSASWAYDTRGRLTSETKVVAGQGTFLTQWAYNFADLQDWIVYPADNLGNAGE